MHEWNHDGPDYRCQLVVVPTFGLHQLVDNQREEKMKEDEFYKLVEDMRKAQKNYFRTKNANYLEEAKNLERSVDKAIKEHEESKYGETLF